MGKIDQGEDRVGQPKTRKGEKTLESSSFIVGVDKRLMYEYSRTYLINKIIYFFRFLLNVEQDEKTDQEKETEVNYFVQNNFYYTG
jgi:hypothetical protein